MFQATLNHGKVLGYQAQEPRLRSHSASETLRIKLLMRSYCLSRALSDAIASITHNAKPKRARILTSPETTEVVQWVVEITLSTNSPKPPPSKPWLS
ncbi:MAG: hypothetical protein BSOLF_2267 [Candidatus Carbobacillus altaicus]|uniref:Uncharacterized protein n=1 Tax=Candidatus Carbonibacillus altaicus TaxID=2163959 RepID=A0A2R6XY92_9BACL|nr:MAG: hypothetical protein BSOLF_2267 [Candidatus Carbobacillus altaicus]